MIWAFDAVGVDATFLRRYFAETTRQELLLRPIGATIYLMPPYILSDEEIDGLAARTLAVFETTIAN